MLTDLVKGVFLPAIVTALVLLPAAWARARARWVGPIALGAGFVAGFVACAGKFPLAPAQHWEWLLWLVAICAAVGALLAVERIPRALRVGLVVLTIAGFAWRIVPPFASLADTRLAWQLLAGGMFAACWLIPVWASARMGPRTGVLVWLLAAAGLAVVLVLGHSARFAQLAGVLAATCGVAMVAVLWRPEFRPAIPAGPVAAGVCVSLALLAMFYDASDVPRAAFILSGVAPAGVGLTRLLGVERIGPWRAAGVHLAAVLLPLAIAVLLVLRAASSGDSGVEDLYG